MLMDDKGKIPMGAIDKVFNDKVSTQQVELNDYKLGDEKGILKILSKAFPDSWDSLSIWKWKHSNRPNFDRKGIITATDGGKMVACFHGAILPLKLEPGIVVKTSFDGDFAVLPEYRGQQIPTRVHDITDKRLKEAGVALRGGFTSQALNERFYHKQFGYVFIPTTSTSFRKVIGIKSLREKVEFLGEKLISKASFKRALDHNPMLINFNIDGFKSFHLDLSSNGFFLKEKYSEDSDISIKVPYAVIMNFSVGFKSLVISGISSFFRGKIRIRGLFSARKKIYSLFFAIFKKN